MKRKKILTVLLSAIMTASILGGCGERQETMGNAEGTRQEENKESKEPTGSAEGTGQEENKESKEPTGTEKETATAKPKEDKKQKTVTQMTKEIHYLPDGEISYEIEYEYEYDAAGNMTKRIQYSRGKKRGWYEYDAAGNETKRIDIVNMMGTEFESEYPCENEYDAAGNLIKHSCADGVSSEYEYDAAGNLIKENFINPSMGRVGYYEYEYDAAGNMTKQIAHDGSDECINYEYEYDAAGNMTKRIGYFGYVIYNDKFEPTGQTSIYKCEEIEYTTITLE